MTTLALPILRRIQILLNTLVGEHHVRKPLLHEVCDLMSGEDWASGAARPAAVALLAALDAGSPLDDFDGRVERISHEIDVSIHARGSMLLDGGRPVVA